MDEPAKKSPVKTTRIPVMPYLTLFSSYLRGGSTLQRENRAYFSEMNCKGSIKDIKTNFFLFKDTSFHFKSVFLQIFKHEFRDLGTSLNLSQPKTTWVSLLYHIDQLGYLKSKK